MQTFRNIELLIFCMVLAFAGAVITWGISSGVYYNRGVSNTRLYYQVTGTFPNESWVKDTRNTTFDFPNQIKDSLKEFKLSK